MKVVIFDDYPKVALQLVDWSGVRRRANKRRFRLLNIVWTSHYRSRNFFRIAAPTVYFGSTKLPNRTIPHCESIM